MVTAPNISSSISLYTSMQMSPEVSVSLLRRSMNDHLYQRNVPSEALQPSMDARPVMTKYAHFPMVDLRKPNVTPLHVPAQPFQVDHVFYGGDRRGPWDGFSRHVDFESQLRNQVEPLVKGGVRDPYIPSSHSPMYHYTYHPSMTPVQDTHAALFRDPHRFSPNPANHQSPVPSNQLFHNPTRAQVKDASAH